MNYIDVLLFVIFLHSLSILLHFPPFSLLLSDMESNSSLKSTRDPANEFVLPFSTLQITIIIIFKKPKKIEIEIKSKTVGREGRAGGGGAVDKDSQQEGNLPTLKLQIS